MKQFLFIILPLLMGCDLGFFGDDDDKSNSSPSNSLKDEVQANTAINLQRTYWTVYIKSQSPSECYMVPRPDNVAAAATECAATGSTSDLLEKYQMCQDNPDPEIINAMNCEDARILQTFLHENLRFTADQPYLYSADRFALCQLATCAEDTVMNAYCSYYTAQYEAEQAGEAIPAIAREDSDAEKAKAANCANELYGIPAN